MSHSSDDEPIARRLLFSEEDAELTNKLSILRFEETSNSSQDDTGNTSSKNSVWNELNETELDEAIENLIESRNCGFVKCNEIMWHCKMCGLKSDQRNVLKMHIEDKHTEGGEHPLKIENSCKVCYKIFSSRNAVKAHITKYH